MKNFDEWYVKNYEKNFCTCSYAAAMELSWKAALEWVLEHGDIEDIIGCVEHELNEKD